jgi:rhodanese-related sulfurtransferase
MTETALKDIDARTLKTWLDDEKAVLIDIREPDEYAREHIPGSRLVPLSAFDPADFSHDEGKVGVFHCASGTRTRQAAGEILATGFSEVYCLDGGLQGWKKAGLEVSFNRKAPISIQRQVQLTAGGMVVLGVVLAALLSPWFALLSAFVGAGLMFAGATGTCALASLLGMMPWNKPQAAAAGAKTAAQPS